MLASLLGANDPYYEVVLFFSPFAGSTVCSLNLRRKSVGKVNRSVATATEMRWNQRILSLLQRNSKSKNEKNIPKKIYIHEYKWINK